MNFKMRLRMLYIYKYSYAKKNYRPRAKSLMKQKLVEEGKLRKLVMHQIAMTKSNKQRKGTLEGAFK